MRYQQSYYIYKTYLDESKPKEFMVQVYGKRNTKQVLKDLNDAHINDTWFYIAKEVTL